MKVKKKIYKNRFFYYLIIPSIIYFIIFHYIPIYGVRLAFQDYRLFGSNEWAGFKYFKQMFNSPYFFQVLKNTIIISSLKLFIGLPVPMILAVLINEIKNNKFKNYVRSVIYLPHLLSWVVISAIFITILSPVDGIVNQIISFFGGEPIPFMTSTKHFRGVLVISEIWRSAGWDSMIYSSALLSIDPVLYEASKVDGANRFQRMWYITFPELIKTMITLFILNMGFFLKAGFDQVFNMMNDAVISVADIIDTYTYRVGLIQTNFSYATAVGLFQGVIGIFLIFMANRLAKKYDAAGLW